jgi:hypothetical protein
LVPKLNLLKDLNAAMVVVVAATPAATILAATPATHVQRVATTLASKHSVAQTHTTYPELVTPSAGLLLQPQKQFTNRMASHAVIHAAMIAAAQRKEAAYLNGDCGLKVAYNLTNYQKQF